MSPGRHSARGESASYRSIPSAKWRHILIDWRAIYLAVLVALPNAGHADNIDGLKARLVDRLAEYAEHGDIILPELDDEALVTLERLEPVVDVSTGGRAGDDRPTGELGVVGLHVVRMPRLLVWLTAMGVTSEPDIRLTRAMLSVEPDGSYVRYQHIDLPWPLRDRHWVIYCKKNVRIAETSNGGFWEHRWTLAEGGEAMLSEAYENGLVRGLSMRDLEESIYLPANRGAWVLSELSPDTTLVIAFFDGELGGLFPDSLVRHFAVRRLREGLNLVAALSEEVHLEYDEQPWIRDGLERPIPREDVLDVVASVEDAE